VRRSIPSGDICLAKSINPGDIIKRSILLIPGEERICCAAFSASDTRVRSSARIGWNVAFELRGFSSVVMREVNFGSERPTR